MSDEAKGAHVTVQEAPEPEGPAVRVSAARGRLLSQQISIRRIFNFAQIFFFSLTFMSSWETMALYARPLSVSLPPVAVRG